MESLDDILKHYFRRCYICNACGTGCAFVVTNDHNSLPLPKYCPYNVPGDEDYDDEVVPNWRQAEFFSGKKTTIECERKFLVKNQSWKKLVAESEEIRQGYFESKNARIRVRIVEKSVGRNAFLTIKSARNIPDSIENPLVGNDAFVRNEYEYEISCADAEAMMKNFCGSRILVKQRNCVICSEKVWYVDEYKLPYPYLVVAEVELKNANEPIDIPEWVGEPTKVDSYSLALLNERLVIKA